MSEKLCKWRGSQNERSFMPLLMERGVASMLSAPRPVWMVPPFRVALGMRGTWGNLGEMVL